MTHPDPTPPPASMRRPGFTVIELLVAIAIILVLVGMTMPAISMVRNSVKRAQTQSMVEALASAIQIYAHEDGRRRYPPTEADHSMRTQGTSGGGAPRTLDLLLDRGARWRLEDLDASVAGGPMDRLVDAWRRPIRYTVDDVIDQTIARPALHKLDWNPKGIEPFGYVWSLGRPSGKEAADADPTDASRWLYYGSSP